MRRVNAYEQGVFDALEKLGATPGPWKPPSTAAGLGAIPRAPARTGVASPPGGGGGSLGAGMGAAFDRTPGGRALNYASNMNSVMHPWNRPVSAARNVGNQMQSSGFGMRQGVQQMGQGLASGVQQMWGQGIKQGLQTAGQGIAGGARHWAQSAARHPFVAANPITRPSAGTRHPPSMRGQHSGAVPGPQASFAPPRNPAGGRRPL